MRCRMSGAGEGMLRCDRGSSRIESELGPSLEIRLDTNIQDQSGRMSAVPFSFHGWVI